MLRSGRRVKAILTTESQVEELSRFSGSLQANIWLTGINLENNMSPGHDDLRWPSRREGEPSASHPEDVPAADGFLPASPATVEDCGLDLGFLADLALKAVYADTSCTTQRAAQRLALPVG